MTKSRAPRYALIALSAVLVLALVIVFFPWRILRGPLESYASHELQRQVTIGDLDVDLGRITRVTLDEITIANAAWSADQQMAHATRMVLFFSLRALFKLSPDYVQLGVHQAEPLKKDREAA